MASNDNYIAQIILIAAALDIEVNTDDLTNKQLGALLKDLKAKQTDAETVTQADEVEAEVEAEVEVEYVVKAGGAITSRRGIVTAGEPVKPSHFSGGQESFDKLVKKGHIVKAK